MLFSSGNSMQCRGRQQNDRPRDRGYEMVSNDYIFVARWGIIIVAVHANRECNPVG